MHHRAVLYLLFRSTSESSASHLLHTLWQHSGFLMTSLSAHVNGHEVASVPPTISIDSQDLTDSLTQPTIIGFVQTRSMASELPSTDGNGANSEEEGATSRVASAN